MEPWAYSAKREVTKGRNKGKSKNIGEPNHDIIDIGPDVIIRSSFLPMPLAFLCPTFDAL